MLGVGARQSTQRVVNARTHEEEGGGGRGLEEAFWYLLFIQRQRATSQSTTLCAYCTKRSRQLSSSVRVLAAAAAAIYVVGLSVAYWSKCVRLYTGSVCVCVYKYRRGGTRGGRIKVARQKKKRKKIIQRLPGRCVWCSVQNARVAALG